MESMVSSQLLTTFKGKRVFVTGHTGFKGTWFIAMLKELGASVKGYALPPEDSKPFHELFEAHNLTENVFGDIRDKRFLTDAILVFEPDFIFHLAAQPLVLKSYEIPAETFEVNVVGTANLLEGLKLLKNKCTTIAITTDKVYKNLEQDILYRENDLLGGLDPYSASKACTELVIESFRNSFFPLHEYESHQKGLATARAGNVIGGGDWSKNRILPDIITSLSTGTPIPVRNPGSIRPWQHVLEPLTGYLFLAAHLHETPLGFSEPFNFGPVPADHLTVKELVDIVIGIWGKGSYEYIKYNNPPYESKLLKLDITKSVKNLNWNPKLTAEEAIQWTVEWYKKGKDQQASYTFEQIRRYFEK